METVLDRSHSHVFPRQLSFGKEYCHLQNNQTIIPFIFSNKDFWFNSTTNKKIEIFYEKHESSLGSVNEPKRKITEMRVSLLIMAIITSDLGHYH